MEVGSVDALSRSIEEEKAAAQQYFQLLTERMKASHVSMVTHWRENPVLNVLYSYFTAMGVGAADLLTTMIQEEKVHAERYLEQLTQRMKDAGVRILVNPFCPVYCSLANNLECLFPGNVSLKQFFFCFITFQDRRMFSPTDK